LRLSEIREVIQLRPVERDPTTRRLAACLNVDDVRLMAKRRLPRAVFDYVDGGADEEITQRENRTAFQAWRFSPLALRDVGDTLVTTGLFGRQYGAPLGLCPTGYSRMMHPLGEVAVARAAGARHLPYALAMAGTTSVEDLASTGHEDLWFQIFVLRDRGLTRSLVERAELSGYRVLEVTVDTVVSGKRERDVRNGLTVPPSLRARTLFDLALHVSYWSKMLRGPALRFANLGQPPAGQDKVSPSNMANLFDPGVTWDDIAEVRTWWHGRILLKGPLGPADAKRAVALGVDGVHLSNHGGRQLDRSLPTAELVRPVRDALGDDAAIVVDSGIRHGADVAVAVALGADLCAVGRPYLYGLAAAGERGVGRVLDLFIEQLQRTMQLAGVASIGELRTRGAELLSRPSAAYE
jgi:L-lactate dehydrogenase (cytochrome)